MNSLCGNDCKICIFNKRCGGCSMCEMPMCQRKCNSCFALCLKRPQSAGYLNSLGGPDFKLTKNQDLLLPEHIPILPDKLKLQPQNINMPIVAVHAGNVFSRNGEKINESYMKSGFQKALNVAPETAGILEFYVKDRTLEGLWDRRKNIYADLKALKFYAVIAPNFSVYEDAPRLDHMYNIKRSTTMHNEMLNLGINSIPDIAWFNINDLEIWCSEINKSNIKTVSFSFQVVDVALKPSNIWKNYLTGFRYLCQNIEQDVKIIIAGLVSPFRIQEVFRAASGQKIHILNQSAFVQSRRGMLSETRIQEYSLSFDELFSSNISYFNNLYKGMNESYSLSKDANIFEEILSWDASRLREFYKDFERQKTELMSKFCLNQEQFESVIIKVLERTVRKKKIDFVE